MKKTFSLLIFLLSILLIINLTRDIYRLYRVRERIENTGEKLAQVEQENQELKEQKKYYQSDEFLEKEIRDKLQMSKPGEQIVLLPQNIGQKENGEEVEEKQEKQTWQKWLELFL
jgi:cell division protein FtsB